MKTSSAIGNVWSITKRELTGYFTTPLPYVFTVIFLLLVGGFTFLMGGFFQRGQASLSLPFFTWHPWLFLVLVPAIGMRLWAEERKSGTIELLLTMPITPWQAILGKFIAAWAVLLLALALTFPVVLTVSYLGNPDPGPIFTGYLGSALLAGAYLSVSSFTSSLTRNQVISFIIAVVSCLALLLIGLDDIAAFLTTAAGNAGGVALAIVESAISISFLTRYDAFQRGVIDFRDVVYFASLIGVFLFMTAVILRSQRTG